MEIKETLLMGKTNFEMRGNLAQKEPLILKKWEEDDVYHALLRKREGAEEYILHDGPPYANGDMHCGHMLNRILKDIILRYKGMSGFYTPFYPGWDTHGLPIENAVTKSGVNRKAIPASEFRNKCEDFAKKQILRQMTQVKRLGVNADFENRYVTLTKDFERNEIHVFAKMALDGLIYKGLKPVYWSPSSESALAEAEIEYADVKATTIFVKFDVLDGKGVLTNDDSFVIWTTTPWTMPANLAICLNEKLEYGLFKTDKGNLVFLTCLEEDLKNRIGFASCELIKTFKGKEFEGIKTKHPMYDRESIIILGDHVTADAGTGCVHTAPGHGADDYIVGCKYGLPPFCPVDEHGYMKDECGDRLKGLFYEKANDEVVVWLNEVGALLHHETIVHSYPHDWRTHKPVIFRATPQWFCSIDKIRSVLLDEINNVNWTPYWGKLRMSNMIKDRGDWCISRQRIWGVPIPIIYNEDGSPIMEKAVFDHIEELIGEYGSNIWFDKEAVDLLPEGYTNPLSPNGKFKKETDIMDVWFDSGSSFNTSIDRGYKFPVDLYLEGSDQYRGWFNSSLIVSVALLGKAPYRNVLSHGFICDEKGFKMSKSLGNGVDPNKIINIYGADVLRLWCATVNYQADVRISENLIKKVSETYRKIRNTFKFMLANISDGAAGNFDIEKDGVKEFSQVATYMLASLEQTKNQTLAYYESYDFANAISTLVNFLTGDCSAFYLSIAKDPLYCNEKDSHTRREVQTVIYLMLETLSRLFSPVLCFTMDEVYQNIPLHKESHIVLEDMPKHTSVYDKKVLEEFEVFKSVRNDVMKALEDARTNGVIGSGQEASIKVCPKVGKEIISSLSLDELKMYFIVSDVEVCSSSVGNEYENAFVDIQRNQGQKCERCWNYFDELIEVEGYHVCHRCGKVIKNAK
ncbi:MAG: isoleucine--tRNA ligase [Bacillales bacterium]|nr:isoleucine--tRNA ligase [Bacillales bacterium]